MKWVKRIFLILIIAAFIFLLVAQVAASFLLRPALERELKNIFHVPVRIEQAGANLFKASFWMKGLTLSNPAGFQETEALSARTVSVDFSILSFLTSELVVGRIQFKDPQVTMEINEKDESNFDYFMGKAIEHFQMFERREPKLIHLITQYTLEKFSVRNGDFQLIDHTEPKRNWLLKSISFSLARVVHPSDPEDILPTAVYMNATVPGPEEGQVLVLGRVNPFVSKKSFDITGSAKNLVFNQYSGLIPEFPLNFKEGTLQLKVKAIGHENQVDIHYQVRLEKLKFSLKEPKQKKQPPVFGLAPATIARFFNELRSGQEPFEFEFQISGNLEDPNFHIWRRTEDKLSQIISERITREMQLLEKSGALPKKESVSS